MPFAAISGLLLLLAACAGGELVGDEVIGSPATRPVAVDPGLAAATITQLRAARGLAPVRADPTLNAIARDYAELMAARGRVSHDLGGSLAFRIQSGGYSYRVVYENIGGGYRSMTEAFDRWMASPSHRANILAESVTEIGIATAFNIDSRYRTYWVLLLARPRAPLP